MPNPPPTTNAWPEAVPLSSLAVQAPGHGAVLHLAHGPLQRRGRTGQAPCSTWPEAVLQQCRKPNAGILLFFKPGKWSDRRPILPQQNQEDDADILETLCPSSIDSLTPRAVDLGCLPGHTAPAAQPPASGYMTPTSGQANNQASRLMVRPYADDTYPDGLTL